ncbi:peptidoglycan hydrolase CwlO-like protein [Anoxybacillus tepidamans]|uniref:Peptidoglycan hydrolase CwlO-like protein n=1 Tax=Anoxybacteroides tepidamans TaxID=265948 RepID=A0A7W8ISX7_9BACL|nr:peptidoglycan hydrolase CwlO-like protein [Anoxybacillus tepidamans]
MSEQLLQQILHAVTHIQQELREIREEQRVIREEQREIREEQRVIREEQQALKNGQKELYDLVNALIHRQEETDAKLESLTMDVHRMHGEITAMKQEIRTLNEKIDSHYEQFNERLNNLQLDVDFTVHKTTMTERELFKMRNRLF